MSKRRNL